MQQIEQSTPMPFPLHALDYGSRRRLRELATPGEAYDFQIAAPHLDGLKPLINTTSNSAILSKTRENGITLYFNGKRWRDFTGDNFYIIRHSLTVKKLSLADAQNMSHHLSLKGCDISIGECQVTSSFLDAISVIADSGITNLTFNIECKFDSSVTPEYVCKKFKKLKNLKFKNDCPFKRNWIDAFVDADMADIESICFENVTTDILDIKQEKLVELFKKQINGFRLTLQLDWGSNASDVKRHQDRLFTRPFKECHELLVTTQNFNLNKTALIGSEDCFIVYEFCEHEL
uniref:FTH domain-containing protein n=1 Tax=Panagrellus redivivus TaxID=6233 RepID=A0A7E4VF86_PANRE